MQTTVTINATINTSAELLEALQHVCNCLRAGVQPSGANAQSAAAQPVAPVQRNDSSLQPEAPAASAEEELPVPTAEPANAPDEPPPWTPPTDIKAQPSITLVQVREITAKLHKAAPARAKELVAMHGADKLTALDPAVYPQYMDSARALAAELGVAV